jgi:hypothetical protein
MPATRYALYFAPAPDSALWRFGSSVIGYDASTGLAVDQLAPSGIAPDAWHAFTAEPRRYGFHATLKAPFRLAEGATEAELLADVAGFAKATTAFEIPLCVARMGSFVALTTDTLAEVAPLERAVVTRFEKYRAPLNDAEIARRERHALSARQRSLLDTYGYPYVLDEFRFHMSLSGPLPADLLDAVAEALGEALSAKGIVAASIDRLAVFQEHDGLFRIRHSSPFSSGGNRARP